VNTNLLSGVKNRGSILTTTRDTIGSSMKKGTIYVIANWKMGPNSLDEAKKLFLDIKHSAIKMAQTMTIICPPVVFLSELCNLYKGKKLNCGAQDIHYEEEGSFTGKVNAHMVKSVGASYVIVGHSEIRALGETDEVVNKKIICALAQKLTVVLCIGEHERNRQGAYLAFLEQELENALKDIPQSALKNIMIAYEPIWAIGKGGSDAMKPRDVYETVLFLRKILANLYERKVALTVPILYGGSVEMNNSESLLSEGGIDGFLIGHASLSSAEFGAILNIAEKYST